MPSPKVDIKEHGKLRDPKNCHVQDIGFFSVSVGHKII